MAIESPLVSMDLQPFVAEAVAALGYFKPDVIEWFVDTLRETERRGTDFAKVVDKSWLAHLTDRGIGNPDHALSTTYRRAVARARDAAQRARTMPLLTRNSPIFPGVIFNKAPQDACQPALVLDRSIHRVPPDLPLIGCDREVCSCSWRTLSKAEFEQKTK